MKAKYLKRFTALVLVGMTLITGCSSSKNTVKEKALKPEVSRAVSFDFIGGKDVMPIGGYIGPYPQTTSLNGNTYPNYNTDEIFRLLSEAGVNLITYSNADYSSNPDFVGTSLKLAEKYGIGMFVYDTRVTGKIEDENVKAADLAEAISAYSDFPSFCGVYLVDEPTTPYFEPSSRLVSSYGKVSQLLSQELDVNAYVNMLPIFDYSDKGKENFVKYVDEFCDTLKPKVLCFDCYIFDKYRWGTEDIYFWMMDVIMQAADKRNLPVWCFIQAGSQWNDDHKAFDAEKPYWPNEAQFNWNINVSLANGIQGFQYFPLIQPYHYSYAVEDGYDFERNGILGAMGNKTQWYNYAQNISKQVRAIDEVLMNAVNKGVIVSGEQAKKDYRLAGRQIKSGKFQQLIGVDGDAMIGCFNYNGKAAYYVVNYSTEYAQNITLQFDGTQNIRMIQNAETSYVKAKNLKLDMAAGEGVLLVIE